MPKESPTPTDTLPLKLPRRFTVSLACAASTPYVGQFKPQLKASPRQQYDSIGTKYLSTNKTAGFNMKTLKTTLKGDESRNRPTPIQRCVVV